MFNTSSTTYKSERNSDIYKPLEHAHISLSTFESHLAHHMVSSSASQFETNIRSEFILCYYY